MRAISALTLRKKLGETLDAAAAGERIIIERDRRPLAVLVSFEDGQRLAESAQERAERSMAALDRLEALAAEMARDRPWSDDLDAVALVRRERGRNDHE